MENIEDAIYKIPTESMKFLINEQGEIKQLRDTKHEDFFDWLACAVVIDSDWDENPEFYREVICRKLVRIGVLKLEGDRYILPDPEPV